MMRVCSNCKKPGHNVRRCRELGRQIIQEQNQKIDREPDQFGNLPKAGLWIISVERKKIAGKISQIKKNSNVLWKGVYGDLHEHSVEFLKNNRYCFLELEPEHLIFDIT